MEAEAVKAKIEAACSGLGLGESTVAEIVRQVLHPDAAGGVSARKQSAAEVEAERAALLAQRDEIMRLLGTKQPSRLMHDLRNVLNQLQLLQALVDTEEEENGGATG